MNSKKNLVRLFSVLVILLLTIVGCGSNESEESEGNGVENDERVTIDIFQFKVEVKDELEALIKEYEEEFPNVDINVKTVGGGNDYGTSLKAAFSSGEDPDIFNIGGPSDIEEYRDYLADVSDTESVQVAFDGTLDTVTEGNEVLGLPFNQEGYGLIYNKYVFEEAGINPEEIVTFSDLEKAVETLDSQKEDLEIDAVFALPGKELWVLGDHISNMFIAPEFDNSIQDAYNSDSVEFQKSEELKRYIDLQNEYSVQPVLSLDYSQQVEQLFSLQKTAMIQQGNWVYNSIDDMDSDFAENGIGILPVPIDGIERHVQAGVPMYWGVNKNSDEKVVQASKDFLDWMYTSETGKEAVLTELKFIPAYSGYDAEKIADPLSQEIYEYSEKGDTVEGWVYQAAPSGWTEDALGASIQKYLAGEVEWDKAIEDAINKWEEARK